MDASPPILLITGAGGKLGQALAARAAVGGFAPRACDRQALDITDAAAVDKAVAGCPIVINAAAYTAVDRAESEPEVATSVNRDGPANLARACRHHGAFLVHVSTDYVFDGAKRTPYEPDDPAAPLGVYGRSKLEGEQAVAAAGGRSLIVRTAWVFDGGGTGFFAAILNRAEVDQPLRVVADAVGSPTFAGHLADGLLAIARALLAGRDAGGIIHLCGAGGTSWHGFAEAIIGASQLEPRPLVVPIASSEYPTPAARPAYSVLDCTSARERFGVALPDWRLGVREAMAQWRRRSGRGE